MTAKATALVTIDGVPVGTITTGEASDVSPDVLGMGNAFAPAPAPSAFPRRFASRGMPDRDFGAGHQPSHAAPHHGRTLGGQHERSETGRHLDPRNREQVSDSTKPQHFTLGDVKEAAAGSKPGGSIGWWTPDRQRHAIYYLKQNAGLPDVSARALVARWAGVEAAQGPGEVNQIGATGIAQWLGDRKRGIVRGDFEGQLGHVVEELKGSEGKAYQKLLGANNEVEAAIGASMYERAEGFNSRTGADNFVGKTIRTMHELSPSGAPVGVTRLGADETPVSPGAIMPGALPAATGKPPEAFIMHHTGGRGTPAGVRQTLRERGLGVEYIMDREGNITPAGNPGASHMLPGWGAGKGLNNQNTVGMEVIGRDDKDVTPAQVEAAKAFIAKNYPNTPVYGHGEVNPGHKEADEGMTIVNAIRRQREQKPTSTASGSPL